MRKLPTFKGYVVDERLRQFRKVEFGEAPEFIEFGSKRGRKLKEELRKVGAFTTPEVFYECHDGQAEITVTCGHCGHTNKGISVSPTE